MNYKIQSFISINKIIRYKKYVSHCVKHLCGNGGSMNYLKRILILILAIIITSMGTILIIKADLGTSSIASVTYLFTLGFNISLGVSMLAINLLFVVGQKLLLKGKFNKINYFQIIISIVGSTFLDILMNTFQFLEPATFLAKLGVLICGCFVMALGMNLQIVANLIMLPAEGLVDAFSNVLNKRFGTIRIIFDVTLVLVSIVLSIILFGEILTVGIGTLISAYLIGKFTNLILDFKKIFMERLCIHDS